MRNSSISLTITAVAAAALMAAGVSGPAVHADTVTAGLTALPTAGTGQVVLAVNTPNPSGGGGYSSNGTSSNNQLNYYASQYNTVWNGQTFTTGNNADGYTLNSISVYDQYEQGPGFPNGSTMYMNVFTPNASSMLYNSSATVSTGAGGNGSWIQYTFTTPVQLAANTLYAFDYNTGSGYAAMGLNVGNGTGPATNEPGTGSASEQLATFANSTSTAPTYWTGANWGSLNNSAAVSASNDPTDVYTDNASFQVIASPVPEPASIGIFAVGGLGLLLWRKRRSA
jgi:hypothetical protein